MLRAALQANPDYSVARTTCMFGDGAQEYDRKHKAGFFQKMNIIKED